MRFFRIGILAMLMSAALSPAAAEMVARRWGSPPKDPPGPAKAATPKAKPPVAYAAPTKDAISIDGKLDEQAWKDAPSIRISQSLDGGGPAAQPSTVRLLRDEKNLYLAVVCTEPELSKVRATVRGKDADIWNDDSVEVFIGAGASYYHFGVSLAGGTTDAKEKETAWNSNFSAATAKGNGEWTAEIAIPLAKLAEGKLPDELTLNVNRNRYTSGSLSESAWSPTFSGDSHVPSRFGQLLFKQPSAEPAEKAEQPKTPARKGAAEIIDAPDAAGVARFDLAEIPKNAKVFRADLLIYRAINVTGLDEAAMVDIEVYPVIGKPGEKPDKSAKPLAIRSPWFDRLDATEAVKQWVSGKANGGFLVKTCPGWDAQSSCLEIAYEGKPADLPPQVSAVNAFHRAGQTFITWQEIKDTAELVGKDPIKWADLRQVVQNLDKEKQVRYCVYRSDKPIDAKGIEQAELIATVKPLSCWNINGRNIDRPIDDFIATNDVLNWHQWNPFRDANTEADYGRDCVIDRLVVEKDPLPPGSGLYVHTAAKAGKAYYAVLASIDGVQNCAQIDQANATGAIEEKLAEPEPVFQRELPAMPMFNFDQKRLHFVHFAAPPYVNVASQCYNWSVGVPNRPAEQRPLELSLPRDGYSYWRTQYRIENDSIVLSPHDFPLNTWWYGYHEALGTLKSFKTGKIQPYTERRLLWMVNWALRQKEWAINPNRILVTGCRDGASASGALHLGLRHPEVFALVISGHGQPEYASIATDSKQAAAGQSMQALWGRLDWRLPTDTDKIIWDELDMTKLVQGTPPTAELPMVTMTSDHGRLQVREFYRAMLNAGRPIIAEFSWGGTRYVPVSATGTYPTVIRMDIRKDRPMIGCVYAEALDLLAGKMGEFNTRFRWRTDDAVDTPEKLEITVSGAVAGGAGDLTIRRMRKFKVQPGKTYAWTNTPLEPQDPAKQPKGKEPPITWPQTGSAAVDKDGLLVLKGVRMLPVGSRLVVHQAEDKQ